MPREGDGISVDVSNASQVNQAVAEFWRATAGWIYWSQCRDWALAAVPGNYGRSGGQRAQYQLQGVWNCTRAVLPTMIKQKYGRLSMSRR